MFFFLILIVFETGSHYAALAGLELAQSHKGSPASASTVLGLKVCTPPYLARILFFKFVFFYFIIS